jgi:signal recognition particle GTPase
MRSELGTRLVEVETAQRQSRTARDELDRVAHELDIKSRSVDTLTHSVQEQTTQLQQLQAEKAAAEQLASALKEQLEEVRRNMTVRVLRPRPPLVIRQTGITISGNGGVGTLQL